VPFILPTKKLEKYGSILIKCAIMKYDSTLGRYVYKNRRTIQEK